MKKFLLFTSVAQRADDSDLYNSGPYFLGDYDTISEALMAAEKDLKIDARELAAEYNETHSDMSIDEYVDMYIYRMYKREHIDDPIEVGEQRTILTNEYDSDYWSDNHVYTVIRIE